MHVALVKARALGDVVRTTCLVPALRNKYPDLHLTWIADRVALPILANDPDIDMLAAVDDDARAAWRSQPYDWVISLDDDLDCCETAARLRGEQLSGAYVDGAGARRYTSDVEPWFGMGLLRPDEKGGIAAANARKAVNEKTFGEILYGCLDLPGPVERPRVALAARHRRSADAWIENAGFSQPIVGLNTSAGPRWERKQWGVEQTALLASRLAWERHARVLVLGGPDESARDRLVEELADHPFVRAFPPTDDVLAFASIVGRCDVLVTSDSLALHLAIAQAVPVVAFFGPTSAAELDIFGLGEKIVTPLPCRCCYLRRCSKDPHCMDSISVDRVFDSVCAQLQKATGLTQLAAR